MQPRMTRGLDERVVVDGSSIVCAGLAAGRSDCVVF